MSDPALVDSLFFHYYFFFNPHSFSLLELDLQEKKKKTMKEYFIWQEQY